MIFVGTSGLSGIKGNDVHKIAKESLAKENADQKAMLRRPECFSNTKEFVSNEW